MKRTISNPNQVHKSMYIFIIAIAIVILTASIIISSFECKLVEVISEIFKNLSQGCIASTIVAWIIDYVNVKKENEKANHMYDAIYIDLKFNIGQFVDTWAQMCAVSFKDRDYYAETHTWKEWYEILKTNYDNLEQERQQHLLRFFRDTLLRSTQYVNKSLETITSQTYMLTLNDAMNSELRSIMNNFTFEFGALNSDLEYENYEKYFWEHIEAINNDLIKYIGAWSDISFYNHILFAPHKFFEAATPLFLIDES